MAKDAVSLRGLDLPGHRLNALEKADISDSMSAGLDVKGLRYLPTEQLAPTVAQANNDTEPVLLFNLEENKAANLLATDPPPRLYVVDGLLPEPVAAAIVAPGGTGKSFWIMQLASSVATGQPFFGHEVERPGAVLMLAAEDDRDELARRLHSILDALKLSQNLEDGEQLGRNFYAVSRLGMENRITHKVDGVMQWNHVLIKQIVDTANAIPDLRLIILDPVSRFRSGDENASEDATKFVEALEIIRQRTGVTVLCAHHSRKGSTGDSQDDIRGASAFVDALRFAATLAVPSADNAKALGIDDEDRRSWVRYTVVKSNYQTTQDRLWMRRGAGGVLFLTTAPTELPRKSKVKGEERYTAFLPRVRQLVRKHDAEGKSLTERKLRDFGGTSGVFAMGETSLRDCIKRALDEGELYKNSEGVLRLF